MSRPRSHVYTQCRAGQELGVRPFVFTAAKSPVASAARAAAAQVDAADRRRFGPSHNRLVMAIADNGVLFGSLPGATCRRGFVAQPPRGLETTHLATPRGQLEFADALLSILRKMRGCDADGGDDGWRRYLHALAVAADAARAGNRTPDPEILAVRFDRQAIRVDVFNLTAPQDPPDDPPPAPEGGAMATRLVIVLPPDQPLFAPGEQDALSFGGEEIQAEVDPDDDEL